MPRETQLVRTLDGYQQHVCERSGATSGLWKRDLTYFAIALSAEAGEFAEAVLLDASNDDLIDELGDNLWGVATCADHLRMWLSDLALRDARDSGCHKHATLLLHMNAYQDAVYPQLDFKIKDVALSLTAHAGRFGDTVKKHLYHGKELDGEELIMSCGTVLRRIANAASVLSVTLEEVAMANVAKLRKRYPPDGYFNPQTVELRS
jgi:NTP pyrophosphatase (non-canonical NTP hydrolase)